MSKRAGSHHQYASHGDGHRASHAPASHGTGGHGSGSYGHGTVSSHGHSGHGHSGHGANHGSGPAGAHRTGHGTHARGRGHGVASGYTLAHAGRKVRFGPVAFWIVVGTVVIMGAWSI